MNTDRRDRRQQLNSLLVGLLAAALPAAPCAAPVHISVTTLMGGQEYGAGISAGIGEQCFVIAPLHVVEIAQSITISDRRGNSALATPIHAPDGVDAILLKVEDNHKLKCPEDWDDGIAGEDAMYDVEFLVSKKVKAGGIQQRRFFPGDITSTTITVQPYSTGKADRLKEGDSGSALYANNLLLGMVVSVDTSTGEGDAIKQSQLHALFSNFMLEPDAKLALVSPVTQGHQENPYATSAAAEFIETMTPWVAMQSSPAMVRAFVQSESRGIAPTYPENVDYVIQTRIIANESQRVANQNYDAKKAQTNNMAEQLLNQVTGKDFQYYLVTNVDVEVTVIEPETQQRTSHVERSEFRDPLTENMNQRDLGNDAVVRATVDAVHIAMKKFGVPIMDSSAEQVAEGEGKKKKKKKKKKSDKLLDALLGRSED
jgi:hypothetical protein